jgi:hypothetical protein
VKLVATKLDLLPNKTLMQFELANYTFKEFDNASSVKVISIKYHTRKEAIKIQQYLANHIVPQF